MQTYRDERENAGQLFRDLLDSIFKPQTWCFFLAVCFPLALGKLLWMYGLSAGAEYIFWLASGINLGAVLLLGWRYSFVILLDVFPAVYIFVETWDRSIFGALVTASKLYWLGG